MAVTSPGPGLVTGLVTAGPVTQKVEASGTVAPHGEATVSFATSGTVAAVEVKPGQAVAAGQTLATLQTAGLQSQVDSANASVASAEQKLQDDENAETSAAAAASSSAAEATSGAATTDSASETSFDTVNLTAVIAASSPAPEVSGGSPDPGGSDLVSQIKAAQQTLITAQQKVDQGQMAVDQAQSAIDADIIQNTALRNAQVTACSTGTSASSAPDPSSSATASTSSGLSAQCASAEADYEAYADTLNSAGNGLDAAITAQDAAVKALDQAISGLDSLLDLLPARSGAAPLLPQPVSDQDASAFPQPVSDQDASAFPPPVRDQDASGWYTKAHHQQRRRGETGRRGQRHQQQRQRRGRVRFVIAGRQRARERQSACRRPGRDRRGQGPARRGQAGPRGSHAEEPHHRHHCRCGLHGRLQLKRKQRHHPRHRRAGREY